MDKQTRKVLLEAILQQRLLAQEQERRGEFPEGALKEAGRLVERLERLDKHE